MSQWHYNDDGQQKGPISLDELKAKIAANELNRNSLVWQVGTKDWAEVQNFPELVEQVQSPPPLPKSVTVAAGSRGAATAVADALPALGISLFVVGIILAIAIPQFKDNIGLIAVSILVGLGIAVALVMSLRPRQDLSPPSHAWRRFFAKILDVEIAMLAGLLAVIVISPESKSSFAAAFFGATLVVWILFEVPMKGKSLGRYLFGVQLVPANDKGEQPDYFVRFLKLSFFGMALGLPIVSMIASSLAYKRLRETGTSKWDEGHFSVTYRKGVGLPLVGVLLLLVFAGVQGIISQITESRISRTMDTENSFPVRSKSHPTPSLSPSPTSPHKQAAPAPLDGNSMPPTWDDVRKLYPGWSDEDIYKNIAEHNNRPVDWVRDYLRGYYGKP